MSYTTIEEYNNYLVENKNIDIDIIEYVKEINKLISNIDISFIDDFIELVDIDNCCIHHSMLKKYGVSNLTGGSSDVKRLMNQNGFINKKDYLLSELTGSAPNGGCTHKNEYYLHPDTFKICLARSQNTRIYIRYFILLEKAIKYYKDYRKKLSDKYVIKLKNKILKKDNIIDKLQETINMLNKDREDQK